MLDELMAQIWHGCSQLLTASFTIADTTAETLTGSATTFPAATSSGPLAAVWSISLRISLLIAAALVLAQLVGTTALGRRRLRNAGTGILRYSLTLASTGGGVTVLLTAADTATRVLLARGLHANGFADVLTRLPLNPAATGEVTAVALGLVGLFGLLPAAFGYAIEMIYQHAAILTLIATAPITAAGLVARSTRRWWWTTLRWLLAAILMKPALAVVLLTGAGGLSHARGLFGLLAAVALLWVALGCPWALYELLRCIEPITLSVTVVGDRPASRAGAPALAGWPGPHALEARASLRRWGWDWSDAARRVLRRPRWSGLPVGLVIAGALLSAPLLSLAVLRHWWAALFTALATALATALLLAATIAVGVAGGRVGHRGHHAAPAVRARPGTSGALTRPQPGIACGDGLAAPLVGRVACHDGPIFPGNGRVCVFHDLLEDRWGATAQLILPETTRHKLRWAPDLTDLLAASLSTIGRDGLADRLSVLARTVPAQLPHPGQHPWLTAPAGLDAGCHAAWAGEHEVFVTLSGPESKLCQPTHAAGGGLTGRAWAIYRLLEGLDHGFATGDLGTPRWLSSPALATTLRPGLPILAPGIAHPTSANLGVVPSGAGDWPAVPTTHAPDPPVCPPTYTHDGLTTVTYAVRPADTGTELEDWAALLTARPGEFRSLALHYHLHTEPPATPSDLQAARRPRPSRQASAAARARFGPTPATSAGQLAPPGNAQHHRGIATEGRPRVSRAALMAITVPAHRPIDDHVACFENDATDRFILIPEPSQDQAFVAACLPLGIGPARPHPVAPEVTRRANRRVMQ
ncbi:MAG TPA: hypothetical protein VGH89_33965 [Pseudonocardia sp.]